MKKELWKKDICYCLETVHTTACIIEAYYSTVIIGNCSYQDSNYLFRNKLYMEHTNELTPVWIKVNCHVKWYKDKKL